jgi:hypothetical protein
VALRVDNTCPSGIHNLLNRLRGHMTAADVIIVQKLVSAFAVLVFTYAGLLLSMAAILQLQAVRRGSSKHC